MGIFNQVACKGLVMMPVKSERSCHSRTRRNRYASREAWHAACEVLLDHFCHYCEGRSAGTPLCRNCQRSLIRLIAAGEDLGLCGCSGVEEWFFECSAAYDRPADEIVQQDVLDDITFDSGRLRQIPISVFVTIAPGERTGEGDRSRVALTVS